MNTEAMMHICNLILRIKPGYDKRYISKYPKELCNIVRSIMNIESHDMNTALAKAKESFEWLDIGLQTLQPLKSGDIVLPYVRIQQGKKIFYTWHHDWISAETYLAMGEFLCNILLNISVYQLIEKILRKICWYETIVVGTSFLGSNLI